MKKLILFDEKALLVRLHAHERALVEREGYTYLEQSQYLISALEAISQALGRPVQDRVSILIASYRTLRHAEEIQRAAAREEIQRAAARQAALDAAAKPVRRRGAKTPKAAPAPAPAPADLPPSSPDGVQ